MRTPVWNKAFESIVDAGFSIGITSQKDGISRIQLLACPPPATRQDPVRWIRCGSFVQFRNNKESSDSLRGKAGFCKPTTHLGRALIELARQVPEELRREYEEACPQAIEQPARRAACRI